MGGVWVICGVSEKVAFVVVFVVVCEMVSVFVFNIRSAAHRARCWRFSLCDYKAT